jgi:hypothetical protein
VPSFIDGLRLAAVRPRLVALIWGWHLGLALALAIPMFQWLFRATAFTPAADALAERVSFSLLFELQQYDHASVLGLLQASTAGGMILALVTSPLLMAGALVSLRGQGAPASAVAAAAAPLYWPFLRVLVFGRAIAVIAALLVAGLLRAVLAPLSESGWEPGWLWALAVRSSAALIAGTLLFASVDYALVQLETDGSRAAFRAWSRGFRFAISRPLLSLGLWAAYGAATLTGAIAYLGITTAAPASGTEWRYMVVFAGVAVLQQVFVILRVWLRLGLLAAGMTVTQFDREIAGGAPAPELPLPREAMGGGALIADEPTDVAVERVPEGAPVETERTRD